MIGCEVINYYLTIPKLVTSFFLEIEKLRMLFQKMLTPIGLSTK